MSNERETYEAALEQLARELHGRQRDALNTAIAAIQRHMDDHPALVPAIPARCPHCRGMGYIGENGEYCLCQFGRDLRRVEERRKQKSEEETQSV